MAGSSSTAAAPARILPQCERFYTTRRLRSVVSFHLEKELDRHSKFYSHMSGITSSLQDPAVHLHFCDFCNFLAPKCMGWRIPSLSKIPFPQPPAEPSDNSVSHSSGNGYKATLVNLSLIYITQRLLYYLQFHISHQ